MDIKWADGFMKWFYTILLLLATLAWAVFTVLIIDHAMKEKELSEVPANVIEASGSSVITGFLITLNVNTNQYWFRRRYPEEPSADDYPKPPVEPPDGGGNGK